MRVRQFCIALNSVLSAIFATAALAQSPIGEASSVQNQVEGVLNRKAQPISIGGSVFQNEHVRTGEDPSRAKLVFLDNTNFEVGPTSDVTLDRFRYDPDRGTGRVLIQANRGVLRFVTGS